MISECDIAESPFAGNVTTPSRICLQFVDGVEFALGTIVLHANNAHWKWKIIKWQKNKKTEPERIKVSPSTEGMTWKLEAGR